MSVPYHPAYRPPFPQLSVVLSVEDERTGPFPALLDTGADVTLVPTHLLEQAGAAESDWVTVRSHFGEGQRLQSYLVEVRIDDLLLPGLYVVGDDRGVEIILGRDVLNKLPLLLDGPALQTDVLDEAAVTRLRERKRS